MTNITNIQNFEFEFVSSTCVINERLKVPFVGSLGLEQRLNKLITIMLISDLARTLKQQVSCNRLKDLDAIELQNPYRSDIRPILFIFSEMSEFVIKKLKNRYRLLGVSQATQCAISKLHNTPDKIKHLEQLQIARVDSVNDSENAEDHPTDALQQGIFSGHKITMNGYLDNGLLQLVVNQQNFMTFEVCQYRQIHQLILDSLYARVS